MVHQMTMETTPMLPTAGADHNVATLKRSVKSGLKFLIKSTLIRNPKSLLRFARACQYRDQFKLSVELIKMLVKYETCQMEDTILQTAVDIVKIRERITQIPGNTDLYDEMVESLGEMFRYFVLVQVTMRLHNLRNQREKCFIDTFIVTARYSTATWSLQETST